MSAYLRQLLFKPINFYVIGALLVAACYALFMLQGIFSIPDWLTWIVGTAAMLLVWQCGIKMPYLGMISMERLVQFHLLLTLPISETLVITTTATVIMPFINKTYRMNSYHVATLRALNNLAMNTIMMLSTFWVLSNWLILPLNDLDIQTLMVIVIAAVIMQVINILMIYIYFSFDRKKVSRLFTPVYLFADFIYVPAGVLSAILWQKYEAPIFYLFVSFMLVLLISFYGFNRRKNDQNLNMSSAGTEYPTSFLDVNQVTAAIKSRCDHLFDAQALFLIELDADGNFQKYLIQDNDFSLDDLAFVMDQIESVEDSSLGQLFLNGQVIDYMSAKFEDHNGVFAQLLIIRKNLNTFLISDLNLLRLFVQRYRSGLSYALTFSSLSEYKNNLEQKVKERTLQLEAVNQEKTELVKKLKLISNSDALTKLYNRRFFDSLLRHFKSNPPQQLTLAIIDIDHFKQINDTYGHDVGDTVIQTLALIMKSWSSENVTLVRYGGEEFVTLIKNQPVEEAEQMLTILINKIRQHEWKKLKIKERMTVSIGLANYPASELDQLFENADSAMYQAKANGRDQLKLFKSF